MANSKTSQSASKANSHGRHLILEARHHDPFSFLGEHAIHDDAENKFVYRTFIPGAGDVYAKTGETADATWVKLEKTHRDGLFEVCGKKALPKPCLLKVQTGNHSYEIYDPYTFNSSITQDELYLFVLAI